MINSAALFLNRDIFPPWGRKEKESHRSGCTWRLLFFLSFFFFAPLRKNSAQKLDQTWRERKKKKRKKTSPVSERLDAACEGQPPLPGGVQEATKMSHQQTAQSKQRPSINARNHLSLRPRRRLTEAKHRVFVCSGLSGKCLSPLGRDLSPGSIVSDPPLERRHESAAFCPTGVDLEPPSFKEATHDII